MMGRMAQAMYDLLMNDKYRKYILDSYHKEFCFLEGAYRSGKSTFNSLAFALYLERTPDPLHLVIATTESLAKSVVEDGSGFGLRYYFAGRYRSGKYKDCPAGFVKTPSGDKIILYIGGAKQNDYTRFRGLSIGGILMTEANLLHQNTFDEALGRILMAKEPRIFIDMNPDNPNHPIYKWLDGVMKSGQCDYLHTTIEDNPAMTQPRMEEIKRQFDPNSVYYRRYILGERVVAENLVYSIGDGNVLSSWDPTDYAEWSLACDPGKSVSATAFAAAGLCAKTGSLDMIGEYHHRNADNPGGIQKYSHDYAKDAAQFVSDMSERMRSYPRICIIDSFSNDDFYMYLCQEFSSRGIPTPIKFPVDSDGKMGKDEISQRIQRDSSLLWRRKLRFSKDDAPETLGEFRSLQYDPKKLAKGIEEPLDDFNAQGHADCVDAADYIIAYYKSVLCAEDSSEQ